MKNDLMLLRDVDRVNWGQSQVDEFAKIVASSGLSLRKIARTAGVTHTYVDKLCNRTCKAELKQLTKVLNALGKDVYSVFDSPVNNEVIS
jgi:transcriptional regulator with XRE-family HTH domain